MSSYEYYKSKWENTKRIRGRAVDCKPLGDRRRTHETVEKLDGDVYACRLYNTDCVKYYPDGSVGIRVGSYATPLTAEFIYTHSPFNCFKQYNKVWVSVNTTDTNNTIKYPVPTGSGELRLIGRVEGTKVLYEPSEPVVIKKQVVDRARAKEARSKIQGFVDWAKTFNKLSDGWIHNETREQFGKCSGGWWRASWDYGLPEGLVYSQWGSANINVEKAYQFLQTCDDDGYMRLYLSMFNNAEHAVGNRMVKQIQALDDKGNPTGNTINLHDFQYTWEHVKRKIYQIADNAVNIMKEVEVQAGSKTLTKVV